jgi:hypothetical protein
MRWVLSRALGPVLLCALVPGCIAPPQAQPRAETTAPPVAGTLYVFHPADKPNSELIVEVVHDGQRLAHPPPGDVLIARDKPAIRLSTAALFGRAHLDPKSCEPIALSHDGKYAACLRSDGLGTVTIFSLADPQHSQHDTALHVAVNSRRMAAFIGNTLAVAADDATCPSFYRTDAHFSFEPRARLFVLDMHGKQLSKGPCIHGLIGGTKKLAFISHDTKENPQYSFDGTSWEPGMAMAFDAGDHLLVINQFDQLVDDQGRLVSDGVVDAWWTR